MATEEKDDKRELIVDAALKRFMHYGYSKTTMTEIGNDLRISKALLYYYFPDKKSLYRAVLMVVANAFNGSMSALVEKAKKGSASAAMTEIIIAQHDLGRKYQNLELFNVVFNDVTFLTEDEHKKHRADERALMTSIIEAGCANGEFEVSDAKAFSEMYLDALFGIVLAVMKYEGNPSFPEERLYKEIMGKQMALKDFLLKAIKK